MTRVLSAVVLITLVVSIVWLAPEWATFGLAAVVAALGGAEFAGLAARAGAPVSTWLTAVAAVAVCLVFGLGGFGIHFFAYAGGTIGLSGSELVIVALILVSAGRALSLGAPSPAVFSAVGISMFASFYVGAPLACLAILRSRAGAGSVLWFLIVMASSDSAQYYTGRLLGRRKLAPVVSPAKTVEGAVGGLVGAALVGAALALSSITPFRMMGSALNSEGVDAHLVLLAGLLALVLAAVGIVGDLFESLLKRSAGAKDSASLIPGHGGVLDRIDSYLLAAPCYFVAFIYTNPGMGNF